MPGRGQQGRGLISMITRIICISSTLTTLRSSFPIVQSFSIPIPKITVQVRQQQQQQQSYYKSARKNYYSSITTATATSSITSTSRNMSTEEGGEVKKRVLVPIAEDSEEIETTCITDVLARFGADVVVASVKADGDLVCKMSRGIKIMADVTIEEASKQEWDLIALPGGLPGANYLRDCPTLITLLKKQKANNKLYGAVCASPAVVFVPHGLIGHGATCYPAPPFRSIMKDASDDKVVVQEVKDHGGTVVTSQGPGTSLLFALALGEQLYGKEEADKIADALLVQR